MLLYFNFFLISLLSPSFHEPFSTQLRTITALDSCLLQLNPSLPLLSRAYHEGSFRFEGILIDSVVFTFTLYLPNFQTLHHFLEWSLTQDKELGVNRLQQYSKPV